MRTQGGALHRARHQQASERSLVQGGLINRTQELLRHIPGFGGNTSFPHFIPDSWDDKLGSHLRAGEGCRRRLICSFHSSLYLGVTLNCLCLEVKKPNKKTSMFLLHGYQMLKDFVCQSAYFHYVCYTIICLLSYCIIYYHQRPL